MPLDRSKLYPFAQEVADLLFTLRPEWEQHASITNNDGKDDDYLLVIFHHESGAGTPIEIHTYNKEITAVMQPWHEHMISFEESPLKPELQEAIRLVEQLMRDEVLALIDLNDSGEPAGAQLWNPAEEGPAESLLTCTRGRLVSYSGKLDRELTRPH